MLSLAGAGLGCIGMIEQKHKAMENIVRTYNEENTKHLLVFSDVRIAESTI